MDSLFMSIYEYKPLNKLLSNSWYSIVGVLDKNNEIMTMNYGYDDGSNLPLETIDENDRYSLQLYNHIASSIDVYGKDILEIGCGRGGGASYIARYLSPKKVVGSDITKRSITFNKDKYKSIQNLSFIVADAHNLPFLDNSFDVVINVETSHHYEDFPQFLKEVRRVLRPKGCLLITDYRVVEKMEQLKSDLLNSGMRIVKDEDITMNVVSALDKDSERRMNTIKKLVPKIFQKVSVDFSGIKGSDLYNSFKNREWKYFFYILEK